jgi:hypothetical protein
LTPCTREEHNLRLFENRVLRVRKDDVTGEWRKLRNEELHDVYWLPVLFGWSNQGWSERVVRMEKKKNTYRVVVWKVKERIRLVDLGVDMI